MKGELLAQIRAVLLAFARYVSGRCSKKKHSGSMAGAMVSTSRAHTLQATNMSRHGLLRMWAKHAKS